MSDLPRTEQLWRACFAAICAPGYTLERLSAEAYWPLYERELRAHFPPEAFFALDKVRAPQREVARAARLAAAPPPPLLDHAVLRHGDAIVAMFAGSEATPSSYRMQHTTVHPAYRRQGVYRSIIAATVAYTAQLGYDAIVSDHAPGNNAVLIAKLRAGFRIVALEIDAAAGPSVVLRYFHEPAHLAAYELRCGLATLTPALIDAGTGAFATLRAQFAAGGR
jgi:GNAT superfamily N-acetyltransferase